MQVAQLMFLTPQPNMKIDVGFYNSGRWRKIEFELGTQLPDARSGCVFAVVGDTIVMHGGFAKIRDTHKKVQGKTFTVISIVPLRSPVYYTFLSAKSRLWKYVWQRWLQSRCVAFCPQDTWLLDMKPLAKNPFTQTPEWTKIRNTGTPPSPRTGQ